MQRLRSVDVARPVTQFILDTLIPVSLLHISDMNFS